MKRFLPLIFTLILIPAAVLAGTEMGDYCSAPPYVSRAIPPNVMILMDNSTDMWKPAYTGAYDPATVSDTNRQYIGYYKPEGCYTYSGNEFQEVLKLDNGVYRSYRASEPCPSDTSGYLPNKNWSGGTASAGPFRGNLMNWATMSKFDVLQKVLIGGNSASKQDNAHTLVSISGDWTVFGVKDNNSYQGCIFEVSSGNLQITETSGGACALLDSPSAPIAFWQPEWWSRLVAKIMGSIRSFYSAFADSMKQVFASAARLWDQASLIAKAWASTDCDSIVTDELTLYGTINQPYSFILKGSGCNNCTFTWDLTTDANWLSTAESCSETTTMKTCGRATWAGTPTAVGDYTFTASMTSNGCGGTMTYSGTIHITAPTLKINTTAVSGGTVGTAYSFTMSGQGGIPNYTWSVTSGSLPPDLSIDSSTGVISGTPTTAGSYNFQITLTDSASTSVSAWFRSSNTPANPLVISPSISITTAALPDAVPDSGNALDYYFALQATGGTTPYSWSITSGALPSYLSLNSSSGLISGDTPNNEPNGKVYTFTITLRDSSSQQQSVSKQFTITVQNLTVLTITSPSPLPNGVRNQAYSFTLTAGGGRTAYTWAVESGSLPSGITLSSNGTLSGTAPNVGQNTTYTFTVRVTDSSPTPQTTSKSFQLTILKTSTSRIQSFNVKVDLMEEPLTDMNGNNIYDGAPESFTDKNGNGIWDGKTGIFQQFWDATNPRARWGLTDFTNQGVQIEACIPASPASSFYTRIQNATPTTTADLNAGLYGIINYYGNSASNFSQYDLNSYRGCSNSDPINSVTCRKNFALIITSGSNVSGTSHFTSYPSQCSGAATALEKNACLGYRTDLRSDYGGNQIVYTYVVNISQTDNNTLHSAAETYGGGKYYSASGADLATALKQAFSDILAQAASGTAVSVLTTSSRGVGSVIQAYFLPVTKEGTRGVNWTGYMKNLWTDTLDNLREDTYHDFKLNLDSQNDSQGDKVMKLYYNSHTDQAEVALFTTDAQGAGGSLASCSTPSIKSFSDVIPLWEAGAKLAYQDYSSRRIYTSNNVISGGNWPATTLPKSGGDAPEFKTTMDNTLKMALNVESSLTSTTDDMINYIRGEDLETSNTSYRDRRVTVADPGNPSSSALKVWKLGDIISSTPRVLANTPINAYDIDYSDSTYDTYASLPNYKQKTSVAFVGANDGMLHAFNVGYLRDSGNGIIGKIKAFFLDIFDTSASGPTSATTDGLGQETWAYIPYNAFPYLKYLAATDYCHIYFNDLSVFLVDASIGAPDDNTFSATDQRVCTDASTCSWRTILIGGMRFGGACGSGGLPANPPNQYGTTTPLTVGYSSYYAIDITDRDNPIPLWEFSDPGLGSATAAPAVIRTGDKDSNGRWYVVIGSGSRQIPLSSPVSRDVGRNDNGFLYILDMKTGKRLQRIDLNYPAIVGDITAVDLDKNYKSEAVFFGTSYWDSGTSHWKGKIMKLDIPEDGDLSSWSPPTPTPLFDGAYPFTAAPEAAKDDAGDLWIYAGSGKYYSDLDEKDLSQQIFIGFRDSGTAITEGTTNGTTASVSTCPSSCPAGELCNVTACETQGTVGSTATVCAYDSATSTFSNQTIATSIQSSASTLSSTIGWKIYLPSEERVISMPLAVGGLVDFLTYKPNNDLCAYGGNSYLYSVGYKSGVAPTNVAIRAAGSTSATSGNATVYKSILLGPGAPPTGRAIIIPPQKEDQENLKKKIQVATGVIVEAENKPAISTVSKIIHWLKK